MSIRPVLFGLCLSFGIGSICAAPALEQKIGSVAMGVATSLALQNIPYFNIVRYADNACGVTAYHDPMYTESHMGARASFLLGSLLHIMVDFTFGKLVFRNTASLYDSYVQGKLIAQLFAYLYAWQHSEVSLVDQDGTYWTLGASMRNVCEEIAMFYGCDPKKLLDVELCFLEKCGEEHRRGFNQEMGRQAARRLFEPRR